MSDLKTISDDIARKFEEKKSQLFIERDSLMEKQKKATEDYKAANTGDRSENAPLEAAINDMREVNASIIKNETLIRRVSNVEDLSRYNSVGIVVLYATVRLECEGEEYIYRIYPSGISYVDIGVMSASSRLAVALMGKVVGDEVQIMHDGNGKLLTYKIKEIY